jgi:internalin A
MTDVHEAARLRADFIDPFDDRTLLGYFEDIFRWHGFIRFVGLPSFQENSSVPIARLFVEPNLTTQYVRPEREDSSAESTRLSHDVVAYDKLVILGDPGSGKSTAISWIAWQLTSAFPAELAPLAGYVPIPIVLRELNLTNVGSAASFLDAVLQHPALQKLKDGSAVSDLLSRGQVLFLLDGMDEIPSALRKAVVAAVREAVHNTYSRCRWIITSRVVGYDDYAVDVTSTAHDRASEQRRVDDKRAVERRYIAPLTGEQITSFAGRWFQMQEGPAGEVHATEFVHAIMAEPQTQELARVPNLLTLMALIYRVHARLPHGRALLYDKIADAYLETIDASKRMLAGGLSLSEKKRILGYVAFQMQSSRGEGSMGVREILLDGTRLRSLIGECIDIERASEFLDYLCVRSGVIQQRGPDLYAFAHLSFQDFFAALYLADQVTTPRWLRGASDVPGTSIDDLRYYFSNVDWRELLILFFEILATRSGWADEMLVALFGEKFELPDINSAAVVAVIATNPHSGLPVDVRMRAIESVWEREIRTQQQSEERDFYSRSNDAVVRVFSGVPRETAADVWRGCMVVLERLQPQRLKLLDCATLNDVWLPELPLSLVELILEGNAITTVESLTHLQNLALLSVAETAVADVTPLVNLTRLDLVNIADTRVSTVEPLLALPELIALFMDRVEVDPAEIERFTGLTSLAIEGVQIEDLSFLERSPALGLLSISKTKVRDLDPLRYCTDLRFLSVSETFISTLEPLNQLTQLKSLYIAGTRISSIEPLQHLKHLRNLSLSRTDVRDISTLALLPSLQWLQLGGTQVTDLSPLLALDELEYVALPDGATDEWKARLRARFPRISFT